MDTSVDLFSLPDDLLRENVLTFLSVKSVSQLDIAVCYGSLRSSLNSCMSGHQVYVDFPDEVIKIAAFAWLRRRNVFLRYFEVNDPRIISRLDDLDLLSVLKHLKILKVVGDFGVDTFSKVANHIEGNTLTKLFLDGNRSLIAENACLDLISNQRNLSSVMLSQVSNLTDKTFHQVATCCSLLKIIEILDCGSVKFGTASLAAIGTKCLFLTRIRLTTQNSLDEALLQISVHCVLLEELDLCYSRKVYDRSILPVLTGCPRLKLLNFYFTSVTKTGFKEIARCCKNLSDLSLNLFTQEQEPDPQPDSVVSEGFRQLSATLTSFNGNIHPSMVPSSAAFWGPRMRTIDLCSCRISDALAMSIAQHCVNLTHFTLQESATSYLTDLSMIAFSTHTPYLQELFILGGEKITDRGVLALARGCTHLTSLKISSCARLTAVSLLPLIKSCSMLKRVELLDYV